MNDAKELDIGNDATDADDDITIKSGHFCSNCNRLQLWRLIGSFPTAFCRFISLSDQVKVRTGRNPINNVLS